MQAKAKMLHQIAVPKQEAQARQVHNIPVDFILFTDTTLTNNMHHLKMKMKNMHLQVKMKMKQHNMKQHKSKMHLQMKMKQANIDTKCHPIRLLTESYICSNSTYLVKCYYKMQPNMHASMCQIQNNTTLNIISWPMPPFKGFYKIGVFKCI